ncbi:hypothetical protein MMPV_005307 [Pyropia vietnamensis]
MDAPTRTVAAPASGEANGGRSPSPPVPAEPPLSLVRSAVLAHCGRLVGAAATIDADTLTAERVGVGLGYLSTVYAATFTARPTGALSSPPLPLAWQEEPSGGVSQAAPCTPQTHTVIVKVAPSRAATPALLDLHFHATEVAFFTRLAPTVACPLLPACYGAVVDAATDAGVVVMEDLRSRGGAALPFARGLPLAAAVAAAAALGRLHAAIDAALRYGEGGAGGSAPIHPPAWADRPPAEAARRATIVAELFAEAAANLAAAPDGWSPPLDAAEWVARPAGAGEGFLPPPPPPSFVTVTHGDAWSNNILFRRGGGAPEGGEDGGAVVPPSTAAAAVGTPCVTSGGPNVDADVDAKAAWTVVGIVDWQVATWGAGVGDLAFLWLSSVEPSVRRATGATAAVLDAYAAGVGEAAPAGRGGLAADWAAALPAALVMCVVSADVFDSCRHRLLAAITDVVAAREGGGPLLVT